MFLTALAHEGAFQTPLSDFTECGPPNDQIFMASFSIRKTWTIFVGRFNAKTVQVVLNNCFQDAFEKRSINVYLHYNASNYYAYE